MLNLKFQFPPDSEIEKELIEIFGADIKNATAGGLMIARQIQKAIIDADSHAFHVLMNQAFGTPKMELNIDSPQKMIIEVRHDPSEIEAGLNSDIHPVS